MILVTGASGKTGRAVIRALLAKRQRIRALVHRPEQVQPMTELGAAEIVQGDMRLPETMDRAAQGTQAIYHICPNVSPDEYLIGQIAIAAARSTGVERFVFHSVLHPQVEEMPHHWQKMRIEELLFKSGLHYTILQPTTYMQNLLAYWDRILHQGILSVPYAPETRISMVDLEDLGLVAATVLTEPDHVGATYELVGTRPVSQIELADTLAHHLSRPVRVKMVPLTEWKNGARASGLGAYQIDALVKMFQYYEQHGFEGNPQVLSWLLGRAPTDLLAFFKRPPCTQS